jgi:hypothetical protein
MFRLTRRSGTRVGIVAAVIGLFALTAVTGASAALPSSSASASSSSSASSASLLSASSPAASAAAEGDTKCVPWPKPTSDGLKCTGTFSGNTAWDPWTQQNLPASEQPVVTISQAKNLTDQDVKITWSNVTPSFDSSVTPNPGPNASLYQMSIFECNGTNPDWSDGFNSDCYMTPVGNPINTTHKVPPNGLLETTLDTSIPPATGGTYSPYQGTPPSNWNNNPADWTGQADFHVEAPSPRAEGGYFRCGPATPCSLVIDPNWGGTPAGLDNYTDTSNCAVHSIGGISPGDFFSNLPASNPPWGGLREPAQGGGPGSLQAASAACWAANRIVIPLSFAPTPQNCPNKTPQFYAQGSPMMQTQMAQWQAGWCTGATPVALSYTFNGESQARTAFLAGGQAASARVDMALTTLPADAGAQQASSRKFTYAPLANSGVDIAYYLDDGANGSQMGTMVLNPRLLAKLTTQSYTLQYDCKSAVEPPWALPPQPNEFCDPAVIGNPYSLFDDPEFLSLNQHCQPFGLPSNYACGDHPARGSQSAYSDFPADTSGTADVYIGGFLPTVLAPNSDMTYDLTGWIAANSDAENFLVGKDQQDSPYVMHVNNNYLGVSYPAQVFNVLDNGTGYPGSPSGIPPCGEVNGQPSCSTSLNDATMQVSWNFQTDLDTIALDLLTNQPTADVPEDSCPLPSNACTKTTQLNPVTAAAPQIIGGRNLLSELDLGDIANYQFPAADLVNAAGKAVGPTQASVEAAVSDMQTNADGITQFPNFNSTDPKAYPLSMVDYAMVPTCGLSSSEASAIADFLTKAATTGQAQGAAPGDLGPGYYPLNAKQKAQALKAAQQVKAQSCSSPPPDHTVGGHLPPAGTTSSPKSSTRPSSTGSPRSASTTKNPSSATPKPSGTPVKGQTMAFGEKSPDSGMAGILLLLAVIAGVLLLVGGPTAWVVTATGKWPVVLRWFRPVQSRSRAVLAWLSGRGVWRS